MESLIDTVWAHTVWSSHISMIKGGSLMLTQLSMVGGTYPSKWTWVLLMNILTRTMNTWSCQAAQHTFTVHVYACSKLHTILHPQCMIQFRPYLYMYLMPRQMAPRSTLMGNDQPWDGVKRAEDKQQTWPGKKGWSYTEVTIYARDPARLVLRPDQFNFLLLDSPVVFLGYKEKN